MNRIAIGHFFRAGTMLPLITSAACVKVSFGCLELDGPCSPDGGSTRAYATRFYVLGFPADRVDRSTVLSSGGYRGVLHVGDAISLQLMIAVGDTTSGNGLPIQVVAWELPDSSAARIENAANGAGILMATKAGRVSSIIAQSVPYAEVSACDAEKSCWRVTEIEIVP